MSWTPWGRPDRDLLRGLGSRVFEDPRATRLNPDPNQSAEYQRGWYAALAADRTLQAPEAAATPVAALQNGVFR